MFKTILGYDIEEGVTEEEYERWLFEVHAPDLLANPYLDRIIFNKVEGQVTSASGGTADIPPGQSFYRIAEMHFADEAAYRAYREWFTEHGIRLDQVTGSIVGPMLFWALYAFLDSFLRELVADEPLRIGDKTIISTVQVGPVVFMFMGLLLVLLMTFRPQGIFGNRKEMAFDGR